MIRCPLFRILFFQLFVALAVEDGFHVICSQQAQPIHDILLIDGAKPVSLSIDLQDIGYVVVIGHLSTEIIRSFKGRLFLRAELKVHFVLLLKFVK